MTEKVTVEHWAKALFGSGPNNAEAVLTDEQRDQVHRDIAAMEERMKNVGIEPTTEALTEAIHNQVHSPASYEENPALREQTDYSKYPASDIPDEATKAFVRELNKTDEPAKLSGGRVNYYLVKVSHPQREEQPPYQAECEDIIEALGLNFDEGNIFKELWRTANERTHGNGKPGNSHLRAAEKIKHYADRILKRAKRG